MTLTPQEVAQRLEDLARRVGQLELQTPWLTFREAVAYARCSERDLKDAVEAGAISHRKKPLTFHRADVDQWVSATVVKRWSFSLSPREAPTLKSDSPDRMAGTQPTAAIHFTEISPSQAAALQLERVNIPTALGITGRQPGAGNSLSPATQPGVGASRPESDETNRKESMGTSESTGTIPNTRTAPGK